MVIMKNKLEAFILRTKSKDGYSVIVGGLCPKGKRYDAVASYERINEVNMGESKDEFLIDYILSKIITNLSPSWIIVVGASICIDEVSGNTGGIIGIPFAEHNSADGEIQQISDDLYLLAFPGGPGVAFQAEYFDVVLFRDVILKYKTDEFVDCEKIIRELEKISNLYVLVSDGSGKNSAGAVYVCDNNINVYEKFYDGKN